MPSQSITIKSLEMVAKQSSLAEGSEGVRAILLYLFRYPDGINNKLLSKLTGIPVPVLAATRQELIKAEILLNLITFTSQGLTFVKKKLGFQEIPEFLQTEHWHPFSINIENQIIELLGKKAYVLVSSLLKKRPEPRKDLDQSRATEITVYRRFILMVFHGQLDGRNIGLLGDDDGLSIVLYASRRPKSITVYEIDTRITEFIHSAISTIADMLGSEGKPEITIKQWDLRNPIPIEHRHSLEVIFTDPPYTIQGARLFLHRGRELLEEKIGLPLYFAFGPKEPAVQWDLQLASLNYGFKLNELWDHFNEYRGNLRLGQNSNLHVFQIVYPKSRLNQSTHTGELYTREVRDLNNKTVQFQDQLISQGIDNESSVKAVGYHILAELRGVPKSNFDVSLLKPWLLEACQLAELIVIDVYTYSFAPHGTSIFIILQESHVSLHSWPEYGFLSLDVFICDRPEKADKVLAYLIEKIKPEEVTKMPVIRGEYPSLKQVRKD